MANTTPPIIPTVPAATQTVAGGSGATPPTPRRSRKTSGSTITTVHGGRDMKAYPVTETELHSLFGLGFAAAVCFSIATAAFNYGLDIYKDLSLNPSLPKDVISSWQKIEWWCWGISTLFVVSLIVFLLIGNHKIGKIKKETHFT
jgi:hypothetical protein